MNRGALELQIGSRGLEDRTEQMLRTSLEHVTEDFEIHSLPQGRAADNIDCLVISTNFATRLEDITASRTRSDTPPVVAIHDSALDRNVVREAIDAGVADIVSQGELNTNNELFARRIVRLADAHQRSQTTYADSPATHLTPSDVRPRDYSKPITFLKRDLEFLEAFLDITLQPETPLDDQIATLLELCTDTLGFDIGVLSQVSGEEYEIQSIHAPGEHFAVGDVLNLDDTHCKRVIETASVEQFVGTSSTVSEADREHQDSLLFSQHSYLGVPVRVGTDIYGTICFITDDERIDSFNETEVALVQVVAEWIGSELLRAQRQREVGALNDRLESLMDATPLAVIAVDSNRMVTQWNPGAEAMFGWSAEEVLGETYPILSADDIPQSDDLLARSLNGERCWGIEVTRETKDGSSLELRLSTAPLPDIDGHIDQVYVILDDVTGHRQFERKLKALQTTMSRLNLAVDTDDIIQLTVDAATEVLGHQLSAFWEYDDQEHRLIARIRNDAANAQFETLKSFGPQDDRLWNVFEKGGYNLYDDLSAFDSHYEGIRSGIAVSVGRYGILGAASRVASEYDDQDLELVRILASATEAALTRADREQRLRKTNEQLDEFASVVAHDLRTPLTAAVGYLDITRETKSDDHFDRIESAHDRMGSLIDDLLLHSRDSSRTFDQQSISLDDVITHAWSYIDSDSATLSYDALGTIECDPSQIGRVFENLFRNALEHGQAETITVERLPDQGFAVTDDGCGFESATPLELFERGHASANGGLGYGLSIVADIVAAHDWTITAMTAPHGGARFEVHPR